MLALPLVILLGFFLAAWAVEAVVCRRDNGAPAKKRDLNSLKCRAIAGALTYLIGYVLLSWYQGWHQA